MTRRLQQFIPTFVLVLLLLGLSNALAQESVELTMIVARDSLTIYIPGNEPASLRELRLEVVVGDRRVSERLQDFEAFRSLYMDQIPTPICLRLLRTGGDPSVPLSCNDVSLVTEIVPDASAFWMDLNRGQRRTVLLMRGSEQLGVCGAGETQCHLDYVPPTFTPIPTINDMTGVPTHTHAPSVAPSPTNTPIPPPTPDGLDRPPLGYETYDNFSDPNTFLERWWWDDQDSLCSETSTVQNDAYRISCRNGTAEDRALTLHPMNTLEGTTGVATIVQLHEAGGWVKLATNWLNPATNTVERAYQLELTQDRIQATEFYPTDPEQPWRSVLLGTTAANLDKSYLLQIQLVEGDISFLVNGIELALEAEPDWSAAFTMRDWYFDFIVWPRNSLEGSISAIFCTSLPHKENF